MKFEELIEELKNENYEVLMGAVATYNADPFLVEDVEVAKELAGELLEGSASVMKPGSVEDWEWADAYEKLDLTSLNQPEKIVWAEGVLVCLAGDFEPLDMESMKEELYGMLEFTEEEYCEKAGAALDACGFDKFLGEKLQAAINCRGTLEDAAFDANDAFQKLL